jgi:hypothetical protein
MDERERELLKQQVNFEPAGEFETPGVVTALLLKDGSLLMNTIVRHESGGSGATIGIYRRMLNAEVVVVKGKWKFIPDKEEDNGENVGP